MGAALTRTGSAALCSETVDVSVLGDEVVAIDEDHSRTSDCKRSANEGSRTDDCNLWVSDECKSVMETGNGAVDSVVGSVADKFVARFDRLTKDGNTGGSTVSDAVRVREGERTAARAEALGLLGLVVGERCIIKTRC